MVESGLSEAEAITAATLQPAKYFRMQDSLGLVKKDYIADLILLNESPLENISNTKDIHAVIKDGNFIDRASLDQFKDIKVNHLFINVFKIFFLKLHDFNRSRKSNH